MKINYAHVLQTHYPRARFAVHGREYEDIEWMDESVPKPTKEYLESLDGRAARAEQIAERQKEFLKKTVAERESYLLLDAEGESEKALERIKEIHEGFRAKIAESLLELKKLEEIKETARQEIDYFVELSEMELAQKEDAVSYLRDTDWLVIRQMETGKEIPESVKIKRQAARVMVEKGEKVYKNFDSHQRQELPSLEERIQAIKAGGEALKRIKSQVKGVQSRYKKPKRTT